MTALESVLVITSIVLFFIVWVLSSRVSRLNDAVNRSYNRISDCVELTKFNTLENRVERSLEKYEILHKDMWELEDKLQIDMSNVRVECKSNNNTVYDRLDALADTLGYKIEDTPNHYKVTLKK